MNRIYTSDYGELAQIKDSAYYISKDGRVFNLDRQPIKERKHGVSTKGYKQFCLNHRCGKQFTIQAHRIVAESFLPNPNNFSQVNHKNEDKLDSCTSNLEWCTVGYNIEYSQAKTYELIHKDGSVVEVFNLSDFARSLGKRNAGNFNKLLRGQIKTCYGYVSIKEIN